jgi:hypothetical protein
MAEMRIAELRNEASRARLVKAARRQRRHAK